MSNPNYFLNLEILHRIANGNTVTMHDNDIKEEKEIVYCKECGFPVDGEYEGSIECHIECKGELNGS